MSTKLVFLNGSKAGGTFDLGQGLARIGRGQNQTVSYSTEEVVVSMTHASIAYRGGRYFLKDEGSRNGTFVNSQLVTERLLEHGDLIQFGAGGPSARFVIESQPGVAPTLDLTAQSARDGATLAARHRGDFVLKTRDLVAVAYQRLSSSTRRALGVMAGVVVLALVGVISWQWSQNHQMERTLASVSLTLMNAQSTLQQNLDEVELRYATLRDATTAGEKRIARLPRVELDALGKYSGGVVLISYAYGYRDAKKNALRYAVDANGRIDSVRAENGTRVPAMRLNVVGPEVRREGTVTGVLVDSMGVIITKRSVLEPRDDDPELRQLRDRGLDLQAHLIEARAYFPPGTESFALWLDPSSSNSDVAVMRTIGGRPRAPTLPLAPDTSTVTVGDQLVSIGYPAQVHDLLFRASEADRRVIRQAAGEDRQKLLTQLAERHLIMPIMSDGSVTSVSATDVGHTASVSIGSAGAPLVNPRRQVIGLAQACSDPCSTKGGIPVRYVGEALPNRVQRAQGRRP